jgi:DNA-binding XRE family transcriptional regulator
MGELNNNKAHCPTGQKCSFHNYAPMANGVYARNLIGQNVRRLRRKNGWTQAELASKLRLLGCYMTRDIIDGIETRRSYATDIQTQYFAECFGVEIDELFQKSD